MTSRYLPIIVVSLLFLAFLLVGEFYFNGISKAGDIGFFAGIGRTVEKVVAAPEHTLNSAYPPLPTVIFYWLWDNPISLPFDTAWMLLLLTLFLVATGVTIQLFDARDIWLLPLGLIGTALIFGSEIVLGRYDILIGIALLLGWRAHVHKRYQLSGFLLMVAAALKIVPIVAAPLVYAMTPRSARKNIVIGAVSGLVVTAFIPWLVLGREAVMENIQYMNHLHASRGIHVETIWSGFNMLLTNLQGRRSEITTSFWGADNAELGGRIKKIAKATMLTSVLVAYVLAWNPDRHRFNNDIIPYIAIALLGVIAMSPILSPQYFVWSMPILLMWCLNQFSTAWRQANSQDSIWYLAMFTILVALGVLTHWIWPNHYLELRTQIRLLPVMVLNLRNILLLTLIVLFYIEIMFTSRRPAFQA